MDVVTGLTKQCVSENATNPIDQAEYIDRYNGYVERFDKLKTRYEALKAERTVREGNLERIGGFMFTIQELDKLPIAFDEKLWNTLVDHVTVYSDERVVFTFQDGKEIEERL